MKTLFGWFDMVTMAMIVIGVMVGRRRGMSSELLSLLMWVAIVVLGAQFNPFLGRWTAQNLGLGPGLSYILAYLAVACLVWIVVAILKRQLGDKLVSGDTFGGFEYYLGMIAGAVRFAFIVLFALALLHAPKVSRQEVETKLKSQRESLGAIYFPPFGQIQQGIFEGSGTGRLVQQHLSFALIQADPSASGPNHEGIGRRRERELDEIMKR